VPYSTQFITPTLDAPQVKQEYLVMAPRIQMVANSYANDMMLEQQMVAGGNTT